MSASDKVKSHKIRLLDHAIEGECREDAPLLSALNNGSLLDGQPCIDGSCGECKCWLYRGNISKNLNTFPSGITVDEQEAGLILPCIASPIQDCDLIQNYEGHLVIHPHINRSLPVSELERISPTITRVRLGPLDQPIKFSAGQFMRITFPNQPSRDYSLANLTDDHFLEFHIMLSPNGSASQFVHQSLKLKDLVHVKGPYGHAHFREQKKEPIICFANGTGLAPMRSITETALAQSMERSVTLLWHMDDPTDFYWLNHFRKLAEIHPEFEFHMLSDQDLSTLENFFPKKEIEFRAYTAGSPPFVDKVIQCLLAHGQKENMIHSDAFHSDIVMEERNIPGYINT